MQRFILFIGLLFTLSVSTYGQAKKTPTNRWVIINLDTSNNCSIRFLGVRVSHVTLRGPEKAVRDFWRRYIGHTTASGALVTERLSFDKYFETGKGRYISKPPDAKIYLVTANFPNPPDAERVLATLRDSTSKEECDGDFCLKFCSSGKLCASIECGDYAVEICYDGKFSATITAGNFTMTIPN